MKKQVQSMWIYCILVVCVAILLIVISVISEIQVSPTVSYQSQEEVTFTKNISDSISTLMENNAQLEATIVAKDEEIKKLSEINDKYRLIIIAKNLYDHEMYKEAKDRLKDITSEGLSSDAVAIYDTVLAKEIETEE